MVMEPVVGDGAEVGGERTSPSGVQVRHHLVPGPWTVPGTMDENERGHWSISFIVGTRTSR
jgi:hypothetical protein